MNTSANLSSLSQPLTGRVAVVTGSSSGIGAEIAGTLARAGASVVVHGHQGESRARELTEALVGGGLTASYVIADISTTEGRAQLLSEVEARHPRVDIWVNNAGADVLTGAAAKWSFEEKLARLWQVDVEGTILLSRAVGRSMKEQKQGVIVNIGWDQAEHGMAGDSGEMFTAIKGSIMAFTRSLAQSLAPEVRVNCVAPGWIKTSWGDDASEYWQQRAIEESLRARWGTPADVAQAILYLVSPAADFITGHTLPVNGGFRFGDLRT